MSQLRNLENLPQPARTDGKPVLTRTDAHAETIDLDNGIGIGADGRPRCADADAVTIAPPRVMKSITSTGPRELRRGARPQRGTSRA